MWSGSSTNSSASNTSNSHHSTTEHQQNRLTFNDLSSSSKTNNLNPSPSPPLPILTDLTSSSTNTNTENNNHLPNQDHLVKLVQNDHHHHHSNQITKKLPSPSPASSSSPELHKQHQADLPVPLTSDTNFFKKSPDSTDPKDNITLAEAVARYTSSKTPLDQSPSKSSSHSSSSNSQSALHPLLKQQPPTAIQTPFPQSTTNTPKLDSSALSTSNSLNCGESPSAASTSFDSAKFKTRSQGGRPKDPVWVYFHTNGNGTDERATCKYCGWHVERPKAFRMRDHIAQCAQVDPTRRAEMSQLIAFKEAQAAAKQEEKAQLASGSVNTEILNSASKKRKVDTPLQIKPTGPFSKSPITSHVLDATSGKPGDDMGIRLDRLTANGFVLIANGTTDADGRCNTLLPGHTRPDVGIYKVTFFSNEFYQKRGIVSFYPFVEITFEIKDPSEHYHIPLLLSPYAFSTYRGS